MLNITDIQDRLSIHPEPNEIEEIRGKITEHFSNLEFIEDGHKYYLHQKNGDIKEMNSVSSVCHRFEPDVDWETILERKAKKLGIDKEELRREWHENNIKSTSNGTLTHLFAEAYMYFFMGKPELMPEIIKKMQYEDGYLIPYGNKQIAVAKYYEDLFKFPTLYPVMPEAQIYIDSENNPYGIKSDIAGTFDALFAFKSNDGDIKLSIRDWKGFPLETKILTNKGFKTFENITVGDVVYDKNGKETNVIHVSEIHHNPCYKIKFDNSDEIICDEDHMWEVSFLMRRGKYSSKVMTSKELYDYMDSIKSKKVQSYKIPKIVNNCGLNCEEKTLPIEPYVLGVWLGDGHKGCGMITNMYDEIFKEINKKGYDVGKDVSKGSSGCAKSRTVYGLSAKLNELNLINNKHIPQEYFLSSHKQRLELLKGIMDTDGHYNKKRKRYVLTTAHKNIADDYETLLSTFGIKPTTFLVAKHYNHNGERREKMAYDICFWSDEYPFKIRKIEIDKPTKDKRSFRNILSIEKVDVVPTKCIGVDSETHTYLVTNKLIVTHNTNASLVNDFNQKKNNTLLYPFNSFVDQPESIYTIQLCLYQLGIEQLGYNVVDRKLLWLKEDGLYEKIGVQDVKEMLKKSLSQ